MRVLCCRTDGRCFAIRMRAVGLTILGFITLWGGAQGAESQKFQPADATPEQQRFFESKIRPLLAEHCFKCHGAKSIKGGLRLDSLAAMIHGGESGPAIVPGKPDESLLIEAVRYEGYEMPPSGPLQDEQIEALEAWVKLGAPWPGSNPKDLRPTSDNTETPFTAEDRQWWAISPVSAPNIPTEFGSNWARGAIDHFIARGLSNAGLKPATEASKDVLIRRLCFDLTGLPPTPQQIKRFLADDSEGAYEALVDRLLESPAYGERFARHWLDVARYADSDGYRADHKRPNSWRYRDYVIKSLNQDKPYDRFVREQIAGDELFPENPEALVATSFLTHGIYEYNNRDVVGQWDIMLDEVTDTIGDVFLGVGMQCSRCHDHKFDPILQKDYYSLRAFIEPILIDRDAVCATRPEVEEFEKQYAKWLRATKAIREQLDALEAGYRKKAKNNAVIKFPASIQKMMHASEDQRTPREHQLAELAYLQVDFEYDRLDTLFSDDDKDKILALRRELKEFDKLKPAPLPTTRAVQNAADTAPPTVIPKKRTEVSPGFLSILEQPASSNKTPAVEKSSAPGRRSKLADWITDPKNPLSTRVIVNRIWQSHFGRGLAPNASDFGRLGGKPSHPELLDWLTTQFVKSGWRLKPLHRMIVTSATYRQACSHESSESHMAVDPQNQWYWRSDVRRLDAEQIRDAILAVSGSLDESAGGPGTTDDKHRRSIYTLIMRNSRNPLLDAFDLPLFFSSTASRDTTTNPLQSLMLINSQAMLDHSQELALRVSDRNEPDTEDSLRQLWLLAYGRTPSAEEMVSASDFLEEQAGRYQSASVASEQIETSTLPYRDGASIVVDPESKAQLRADKQDSLQVDEFTVEAIFQLGSVYDSGSVRSIVSTWTGNQGDPGWTFGVTGKGSRRKPQTLVLHAFGSDGNRTVTEAAVFSDQHVDIGKPYYAAASVRMGADGIPGKVTFYLKDLSDEEQPISVAEMDHRLIGNVGGKGGIAVGARTRGNASVFDGLIDDVRLSNRPLDQDQLLLSRDSVESSTIAFWRFEPSMGLEADISPSKIDLRVDSDASVTESPRSRAFADLCHVLLNSNEFLYVR